MSWLTRERLVVAGLLLFTAVLRGCVLWGMRGNLEQDPDAYREIAENVLQHGVYGLGQDGPPTPTAYRPPLYPIVLSNLPAADGKHVALWKVAVLHVVLLCLTFTAVHTLYWCNLRMRAPLMPFVALVAAAAISPLAGTKPGPGDAG